MIKALKDSGSSGGVFNPNGHCMLAAESSIVGLRF
jgi:hypothetical protein